MGVVAPFWASQASRAQLQREPVSASIGHFATISVARVNQKAGGVRSEIRLAPQVGLEPTTLRLTAECSTIELLRSNRRSLHYIKGRPGLSIFAGPWQLCFLHAPQSVEIRLHGTIPQPLPII